MLTSTLKQVFNSQLLASFVQCSVHIHSLSVFGDRVGGQGMGVEYTKGGRKKEGERKRMKTENKV